MELASRFSEGIHSLKRTRLLVPALLLSIACRGCLGWHGDEFFFSHLSI